MPIPAILASPPWEKATRSKGKAAPRGVQLEPPPIADTVVWGPSGRTRVPWGSKKDESPALDADVLREAQQRGVSGVRLFDASDDTILAILEKHPGKLDRSPETLRNLLSRLGQRTIPFVLAAFDAQPFEALETITALRSARIAPFAAEAWHKRKTVKLAGGRWLVRHPETATLVLLPVMAGKPGKARDAALAALSLIEKEEPAAFAAGLDYYGDAARSLWKSAREEAPATGEPEKAPPAPSFLSEVTAPELASGGALAPELVRTLCGVLALAPHPEPHPAHASIVEAMTPESLAVFARSLFEAWVRHKTPREHGYIARAAIHLGDDALIAELADLAEDWGSSGGYARAVWIADALAVRGTDTALGELDHIARRARSWSLRLHAGSRLNSIAQARGISREDLADQLVPDLGVGKPWGEDGDTLALDGEELVLVAPNGQRSKEPRGEAARKAFGAVRKEARTILSRQRARLESAMLDGRTWTSSSFAILVAHPVLGQLARRLVWIADDGSTKTAVRVAEDGSLADLADAAVTRTMSALHLAHPVELGTELDRWRALMGDYELIEPFPQIGREVFASDVPLEISSLIDAARLAGVARRGWTAGEVEDGGRILYLSRSVRGGTATMDLDPGFVVGSWSSSEPQQITVSLSQARSACPTLVSEVRRDLVAMTKA